MKANSRQADKVQLTISQAMIKARAYCVYQERYQQEMRDKLYEWGLWKQGVESLIAELISTDFINEERYAKTFAGGKFRIKKWGRVKIQIELKRRNITSYCIKKGLQEIDEADYIKTIKKIIADKALKIKDKNPKLRQYKIGQYVISRGFEPDLVWGQMNID